MNDLLKFNNVNLDVLTETYNMQFYYHYMSRWPEAFMVAEGPNSNDIMGYVLGKAEGEDELWHGHVSAVTVAPSYRRLGLAKTLMDDFERLCIHTYNAYFVDLFVREANNVAQEMYEKFGYSTCKFNFPAHTSTIDEANPNPIKYGFLKFLTMLWRYELLPTSS